MASSFESSEHDVGKHETGADRLIDPDFYLEQNPDVAEAGVDPLEHYMEWGWREGRDPNPYFDTSFYLEANPDVAASGENPLLHYLLFGWREGRDPSAKFSTGHYLRAHADVRSESINPLLHFLESGQFEQRSVLPYARMKAREAVGPPVSVVVPNYNHARFLRQRIESILSQTYGNIEIIILDDASTDQSVQIIEDYTRRYPGRIRSILSRSNSGSVFRQWRRGLEEAAGELVWICESDDFCEPDFLEHMVPHFLDRSVMIAFGCVQFADAEGRFRPGLDAYREQAEAGIWHRPQIRSAAAWFRGAFGVANIIPNVGGCVFRKVDLTEDDWNDAFTYHVLGDWYLYALIGGGGRLAYEAGGVAYFRQHDGNTSVTSFTTAGFYREHHRFMRWLHRRWNVPQAVVTRYYERLRAQFDHFSEHQPIGDFDTLCPRNEIVPLPRKPRHILIGLLGFYLGGGEIFPISLANELTKRGYVVSVLVLDYVGELPEIRARLDSRIAIYDKEHLLQTGVHDFIDSAGIDLVHTHYIRLEYLLLLEGGGRLPVPYVATLHGSYENADIDDETLQKIGAGVDHWVYLTANNIRHLERLPAQQRPALSRIPNGVVPDDRPFERSRSELGIGEDDVVFALVSRAVEGKGWREAIRALRLANGRASKRLVLLLCGSGPLADELAAEFGADEDIKFLGFQDRVHGLFRISDCALLPTRFVGESYPLTIIQAFQAGRPVISTDVGEISAMVGAAEQAAGIVVAPLANDVAFAESISRAMLAMTESTHREKFARNAVARSADYGMDKVGDRYVELYESLMKATAPQST